MDKKIQYLMTITANKIRLPGTSLYTQLKQALDGGKK